MIYDNIKHEPFDDTVVRAVDMMVDRLFGQGIKSYHCYLSANQYVHEYNTLDLRLPRQCGKTTYLKKLLDHLPDSVLFCRNHNHKMDFHRGYSNYNRVYAPSDIRRPLAFSTKDVFLFDECDSKVLTNFMDTLLLSYHTKIISLRT